MKAIVIGAGILGASTAYHLARAGVGVTLVDRADEGRATAAGAGIVCPWGSAVEDPAYYALLAGGARYYARLVAMLAEDGESDLGYAKVGGLYVPGDGPELDATERRARARAVGAPEAGSIERVSAAEARNCFRRCDRINRGYSYRVARASMAGAWRRRCSVQPLSMARAW